MNDKIKVGTLVTRPNKRPQATRHGIVKNIKGRKAIVKFWGTKILQEIEINLLQVTT
jgi:hypothetical protein